MLWRTCSSLQTKDKQDRCSLIIVCENIKRHLKLDNHFTVKFQVKRLHTYLPGQQRKVIAVASQVDDGSSVCVTGVGVVCSISVL